MTQQKGLSGRATHEKEGQPYGPHMEQTTLTQKNKLLLEYF